uniref:Uncharacterized protein n=1 Tax=Oryza sativa subsp. japonica TaxID=39947 RepID=Q6ZKB5_ORYSJ|nr:hypothetical protein [Oryza sativa Japonica Group]BAD01175.1 hypothetical protein [Oryza sativa Japonica Group]
MTILGECRDNIRLPLSASCGYLKGSDKALSALGVPSRSSLRFLGGLVKTAGNGRIATPLVKNQSWKFAVREIAMYWFENQRASRIISRTPMEVAVREIATYWFENQRTSRIISRTSMEVAVREIATYWFENQRASRIISRTPMEVAVRESATYWFEDQRTSRIISRIPMEVAVREIATYWFENQQASRIISRTPMEVLELVYCIPAIAVLTTKFGNISIGSEDGIEVESEIRIVVGT